MTPRRIWLLVLAIGLTAVGCGVPAEDRATFEPDDDVPFGLLGTAPPSSAPAEAPTVPVCLVRGDQLEVVDHPLVPPATPLGRLRSAAAPLPGERAQGLSTSLSDDAVTDVTVTGSTATVSLGRQLPELAADVQLLAVAQAVCTLTTEPPTTAVRFTVDGAPVEVPRGNGSTTSDPVIRADYPSLIPS
jgi:hypothetical protein